jgi:hypothetical protein
MPQPFGRRISVSLPRRFMSDLAYFGSRTPLCTAQRTMRLAPLVAARSVVSQKPGWCTIFTRAYALVAARRPELRWAYIPLPWAHFYEHPFNIASVAIERDYRSEKAVFFAHIRAPEHQSLASIEAHLRRCKEAPIEEIALFRRVLNTCRLPVLLRRLVWQLGLSLSGHRRSRVLGTFGISVTSALGASTQHLLTPISTALNYDVFAADGSLDVRLTYDHRVMDGGTAARTLAELEDVLKGVIVEEMEELAVKAA